MLKMNALFCLALSHVALYGSLEGFRLTGGEASAPVSDGAGTITIKSGKQAIIEWDRFSLSENEVARFLQKDSHSSLLNRVMGKEASSLLGRLESNGHIYLINPEGVLIGPNGHIECQGFIASTLDLLNEDFLKGKDLHFFGKSEGSIINQGHVKTSKGDLIFIATTIHNEGTLTAHEGDVGLISSSNVILKPTSENIFIKMGSEDVSSSYEMIAQNLQEGASPYSYAISQQGTITATTLQERGGRVYLIAEKGSCLNLGDITAPSGDVRIHAPKIFVDGPSVIDVSGKEGGMIHIGGEREGAPGPFSNSAFTSIEEGVQLLADGYEKNGGLVVVYADHETSFDGEIFSRALGNLGDGGDAEVSADILFVTGHADLRAKNGKTGTLLYDPSTSGPVTIQSSGSGPNIFLDSAISAQLATANYTLTTTNVTPGDGTAIISFSGTTNISWSAPTTFSLIADNRIAMNSTTTINSTYSGPNFVAMNFQAFGLNQNAMAANPYGIVVNGTLSTVSGDIQMTGTGGLGTTGSFACGIFASGATALVNSTGVGSNTSGNIFLTGTGGSGTLSGADGIFLQNGPKIKAVDGTINMQGTGTGSGTGTVTQNYGVVFSDVTSSGTEVSTSGTGNITLVGVSNPGSGTNFNTNNGLVFLQTNTTIACTGSGSISLHGTSAPVGSICHGIDHGGTISTTSGNITMIGLGRGDLTGSGSNVGTRITGNTSTTSGIINIQGQVLTNGSNNDGVMIGERLLSVGATGGLAVTGLVDSGMSNRGVRFASTSADGLMVHSAGAPMQITGTVTNQTTGSRGVLFQGLTPQISQFFSTGGGNITITGDASSSTGVNNIGVLVNNLSFLGFTGATATGVLTVNGTGGPILDALTPSFGVSVSGPTSSIDTSANLNGAIVINGTATGPSTQSVRVQGGGLITSGSTLTINCNQDLEVIGSSTASFPSRISAVDEMTLSVGRNALVQGGSGVGSYAQIGSSTSPSTGNIHFSAIGNTLTVNGSDSASYALVGHGSSATSGTYSGDILVDLAAGDITVIGAATGTGTAGFAQIGHLNSATTAGTLVSGNINMLTATNIYVTGGSLNATGYAQIGHGGQAGGTTYGPSSMLLIAGQDINITSQAGQAQVTNLSQTSGSGNLYLVVDNLFPTSPGIGMGEFILNSLLTATGELRIYTARQSLNTVNSPINGVTFVPGTFNVDTTIEEWLTYYPGGTYTATDFKFYYKDGIPAPTPPTPSNFQNPLFSRERIPPSLIPSLVGIQPLPFRSMDWSSTYLGSFCKCSSYTHSPSWCGELEHTCEPHFHPYGSFIFQDGVYYWNSFRPGAPFSNKD